MSDEDLEEQANELLALCAIYGDDAIILPTDVGCTSRVASYSIEIDLELEEPLNVFAPASSTSAPPAEEVHTDVSDDNPSLPLDPRRMIELNLKASSERSQPSIHRAASRLTATVSHLPPITLSVVMPLDYPSFAPPEFTLSAMWLGARQLSRLVRHLDAIWREECAGSICIFRWAEWLRHESLGCLDIRAEGLMLCDRDYDGTFITSNADNGEEQLDPRAISYRSLPAEDFEELMRHAWEAEEAMRCAEVLTCPICLEERDGASCVRGMGGVCSHPACARCLVAMVQASIEGGDVDDVKCVRPDCRAAMPSDLIARLCPEAMYKQWEARKKAKLLLSLPGLCYCPRCDPASADFKALNGRAKLTRCTFFARGCCLKGADCRFAHSESELAQTPTAVPCLPVSDGSNDDSLCICPECRYTFCAICHEAWHPGVKCASSDAREEYLRTRERLLRENGGDSSSSGAHKRLLAARTKLDELKSLEAIRKMAKPCPSCGQAIAKNEGCNHMHCRTCSTHFCWTCLEVISELNPYDHFRSGGCKIFPDAVPTRQQEAPPPITAAQRREDRLARQQLRLALRDIEGEMGTVARRCPFCGARCLKGLDNSNHHRCESCLNAFCFLCLADLRRGVRGHFNSRHPQHSVRTPVAVQG